MGAVVHRPGEGERHAAGPTEIVIKATGDDTGGSFFLAENVIPPGFAGPPLHRHETLHDMFYVLDGTLTVRLGDETAEAGPGTFVCVPPGVVHTFANPGDEPVRFLNFNTPSGWEHYMRELAEAARSGPLTPEAIGRVASRHDFEVAT
jgi:mannose-6-phosphate isomerase-like protein (cupin superfamily)